MLPKSVNNILDRLCRNFLWGSTDERRKLHPVSWEVVARPKKEGGLGLKRAEDRNKTLVGSLAWRAATSRKPWAGLLRKKYGLGLGPGRGNVVNSKALREGSRVCTIGSRWVIGGGRDVKVWTDRWLGQSPLRRIVQGPLTHRDEHQVVGDLLDDCGNWCWHKLWYNLPQEVLDRGIGIPRALLGEIEDRVVWGHEPSGHYSTKSAYNISREPKVGDSTDWNWIWEKPITPQIQIFLWQCCHLKVMMNTFLRHRGIDVETGCRMCHRGDETLDHIFHYQPLAITWYSPLKKGHLFPPTLWVDQVQSVQLWVIGQWPWMEICLCPSTMVSLETTFKYIFEGRTNDSPLQLCLGWAAEAQATHKVVSQEVSCSPTMMRWYPPDEGWFKPNSDDSVAGNPGRVGAGGVLRDSNGN